MVKGYLLFTERTKCCSQTYSFMALMPLKTSLISLTLASLRSISFVLNWPILLAISLFTGISITLKTTPARNDIPSCP